MFATTLTTDRLTLRPPKVEDAEAIFTTYSSDPEVTRFLSWPTHQRVQETRAFLAEPVESTSNFSETRWILSPHVNQLAQGMITAWQRGHQVEIGYCLARNLWGHGVMTEAVQALMQESWRHPAIWRIKAFCHVDNHGSARVLEKCGLQREGLLRRCFIMPQVADQPQDCFLYAQVRDDLAEEALPT